MMMVVGTGLIALVISVIAWPLFTLVVTIPHEGGHAIVGSVLGGRIGSIRMDHRGNGVTLIASLGWFGSLLTGLAGYIGPSIFGIAGAALLAKHQVATVLWISVALLVLALLRARGLFTLLFTVFIASLFFVVARYASAGQQEFFAYTWVWILLLGGFRDVVQLQVLRRDNSNAGDVGILRSLTKLPGSLWGALFWLVTLVALIYGACLMLGYMHIESLWALVKSQLV